MDGFLDSIHSSMNDKGEDDHISTNGDETPGPPPDGGGKAWLSGMILLVDP